MRKEEIQIGQRVVWTYTSIFGTIIEIDATVIDIGKENIWIHADEKSVYNRVKVEDLRIKEN